MLRRAFLAAVALAASLLATPSRADQYLASSEDGRIFSFSYTTGAGFSGLSTYLDLGRGAVLDGLAFGPNGSLYVTNLAFGTVTRYTTVNGSPTSPDILVSRATGGPAYPFQLAFIPAGLSGAGDFLVSDYTGNRIQEYTRGGTLVGTYASGGGLSGPTGLAFDSAGNLFVSSSLDNRILRTGPGGGVLSFYGGNGLTGNVAQLAFRPNTGDLFGAGFANMTGRPGILYIPSNAPGTVTAFDFGRPSGVAFDAGGNFIVADYEGGRIIHGDGTVLALPAGARPMSIVRVPSGVNIAAVPEPSSLALCGVGAIGLAVAARRRRRRA